MQEFMIFFIFFQIMFVSCDTTKLSSMRNQLDNLETKIEQCKK